MLGYNSPISFQSEMFWDVPKDLRGSLVNLTINNYSNSVLLSLRVLRGVCSKLKFGFLQKALCFVYLYKICKEPTLFYSKGNGKMGIFV